MQAHLLAAMGRLAPQYGSVSVRHYLFSVSVRILVLLLALVIGGEDGGVITRERTSGTGIAAEARMEGSRPPSSTCVFADSTRSSPCGGGGITR